MPELDYCEIKIVVRPGADAHFTARPRRRSPVSHFTIGQAYPRPVTGLRNCFADLSCVLVLDLLVGAESVGAFVRDGLSAELFDGDRVAPVLLTLPTVECSSQVDLVLRNTSKWPASIRVRFYWSKPQHD